jgi:hypothetical protein
LDATSRAVSSGDPKGGSGKFQSLFWDIRIKDWRQSSAKPWKCKLFDDAFEMVMPSMAEIRLQDPTTV